MTDRELMQQALEALELLSRLPTDNALDYADNAIDALKERLAQPEQEHVIDCPRCGHCCPQPEQEPYGYVTVEGDMFQFDAPEIGRWKAVYTTPPQRKPLTDGQDAKRWQFLRSASDAVTLRIHNLRSDQRDAFIDAEIKAAHGIKGEA